MLEANRRALPGGPIFSNQTILCTSMDLSEEEYRATMDEFAEETDRWLRRHIRRRTGVQLR